MTYDHLMTNKEAIKELKKVSTIDMPIRLCEAYYMSLKALEQEPCGETVSLGVFKQVMWERDIAIEQLKELGYGFGQKIEPKTIQEKSAESEKYQKAFDDGYENGYAQARFDYEQEPKTGHWKRISIDKYSEHAKYWYRCDRCGKDNLGNTDWCPNCGCRMVEPQESEE